MGIFSKFRSKQSKRSADNDGLALTDPRSDFWFKQLGESRRPGGEAVNATTASRVAAVFACHTAIKESVAMLPATTMTAEDDRTNIVAKDHYLYKILHDQPNDFMDSFEFFEAMQTQALDYGNAYAAILRKKSGAIISLMPLLSEMMKIRASGGALAYEYIEENGQKRIYQKNEIFHFKPHTKDGICGRTPICVAADTVGFSLALLNHGNSIFENGAFHSGFIQAPHAFKDDEGRKNFFNSFVDMLRRGKKIALLEQGVTFKESSMNNRDAQFLEAKEFSVVEIARIFRMPPVMIQAMDKGMSFASVEQLNIMFVQYTIQPWVTRWERAIKRQLLKLKGEESHFVKFNVNALMRGDLASRINAIIQQLQYGLLTINEARALEDRNPIIEEIGDKPLLSHNLRPADEPLQPQIPGGQAQNQGDSAPKQSSNDAQDPQNDTQKQVNSEPFEGLFRSILGRYVRRSRKENGFDAVKIVTEGIAPAAKTLLTITGRASDDEQAGRMLEHILDVFFSEWRADKTTGETEEAETARRARALYSALTAISLSGDSKQARSQTNINVNVAPSITELKFDPPPKRISRLTWEVVNGKKTAVITEE